MVLHDAPIVVHPKFTLGKSLNLQVDAQVRPRPGPGQAQIGQSQLNPIEIAF